ncbi:MAG: hypothetical protein ACYTFG_01465 [Planctomycetota bacterium]
MIQFRLLPDEITTGCFFAEADTNGDGELDGGEQAAFEERQCARFQEVLFCLRIGTDTGPADVIGVRDFDVRSDRLAPESPPRFTLSFTAHARLPDRGPGEHVLEVELSDPSLNMVFTQVPGGCLAHPVSEDIEVGEVALLANLQGRHRSNRPRKRPGNPRRWPRKTVHPLRSLRSTRSWWRRES